MIDEFLAGLAVLVTGGVITYFIKPPLDVWLERRQETYRRTLAEMRRDEQASRSRAARHLALGDYKQKVVRELKKLRILDMAKPLDLEETYVHLSIQEEQARRYAEGRQMQASVHRDPNSVLDLRQERLAEERGKTFSPEEAMRRFRHLAVLGDPGAGKTTMLKYLCLLSAQGKARSLPDFPIFISLNRFAKAPRVHLLDFIVRETTERYGLDSGRSFIEDCLEHGHALLLLDGLDEASVGSAEQADEAYRHTVSEINKLSTRFPKVPMVVTSRRAGWRGQLAPTFTIAAVLDFSSEHVRQFVENWFGKKSDRARDLQLRLSEQVQLQELAANPLLLSLIAIVYEQELELPERRAKLYERCVHVLLTEWDAHRGIKRTSLFTADRKRDLLEDIALHFHCRGMRYFSKEDLLEVVGSYLPTIALEPSQAEAILAEITNQHGLLKEQAIDWYGFLHLTLQEYFSALSIDRANAAELALANINNPWWEEVILLLAGMSKDASLLLKRILNEPDDIFHSRLSLAGRCLAGTPRITEPALRREIIDRLRAIIRDDGVHWLPRTHAVRALREADGRRCTDYLLEQLVDPGVRIEVRVAIVDALKWTATESVPDGLIDVMVDEHQDLQVREWIASAVIEFGRPSLVPRLIEIAQNADGAAEIRGECARAIGHWGDASAIEPLRSVLVSAQDRDVAWRTARALCALGAISSPRQLRALLVDERIHQLGRWALGKAVESLDETHHPEIVAYIEDTSLGADLRLNLARWMGHASPDEKTQARLRTLFRRESMDPSVRGCLGLSLMLLADEEPVPQLKAFLDDPSVDAYVKKKIAETLIECGERDISRSLLRILKTALPPEGSFVRLKMAELIGSIGDRDMMSELLAILRDEGTSTHIRLRVADAVARFDVAEVADDLTAFVLDDGCALAVRRRAAYALSSTADAVERLLPWLERDDIGEAAFVALFRATSRQAVRVLKEADGRYSLASTKAPLTV